MKFKLIITLCIVLLLTACSLSDSQKSLEPDNKTVSDNNAITDEGESTNKEDVEKELRIDNNILSGNENIDRLVINEIKEGKVEKVLEENSTLSLEHLLNIKVVDENVYVLLRDKSETVMVHYVYENNGLLLNSIGGSGNNEHVTDVSIGRYQSHEVDQELIIGIVKIIINNEELYNLSDIVELHFKDGTIKSETVENKGMLILINYNKVDIDEELLKVEKEDELEAAMEKYEKRLDYLLLKDVEGKIIYDSREEKRKNK